MASPEPTSQRSASSSRASRPLTRAFGLLLVVGSGYAYWESLRQLDRREYVAAALAMLVGWLVTQTGIELVRPESAE